ncbi:hypothetical protein L1887_28125 [Cichorium endivia]|nr:hypothetical protein L1887_28125 [Cichorium endivia]
MYLQNIWLNESSLGVKQLIPREALSIEDEIREDSAWHSEWSFLSLQSVMNWHERNKEGAAYSRSLQTSIETDSTDLAVENMILMGFKMHKKESPKGNGFWKS